MALSLRRLGIAFGAVVEAALVMWLLSGFLAAGALLALLTILLGFLIYRDITRRDHGPTHDR